METLFNVLIILFFVFMNAFFVLAEFAMVKVRRSRVELLAGKGSLSARYTLMVVNDLNNYLSACQLGITLASLALGWLGEPAVAAMMGPPLAYMGIPQDTIHVISFTVGFLIITGMHIVGGELIPKSLAIINAERFSAMSAIPLVIFYKATYPVMWLFNHTTSLLLRTMGYSMVSEHEAAHTNDEIKILVEESYKQGLIDKSEFTYVDNIFEFGEKDAMDVMVPRRDMSCVFRKDPVERILAKVMEERFTRFPVCDDENKDNIVGYVNVRDLYTRKISGGTLEIDAITRNIISVAHTTPLATILKRFQKEKENIAVVIDEYGGTAGMITLEDVLEEIVGNIEDEYDDEEESDVETVDADTFLVRGTTHLDRVFEITGVHIPTDDYDTVNGFLLARLQKIPLAKDRPVVNYENLVFKVEKVGDKRILLVRIIRKKIEDPGGESAAQ